VACQTTGQSTRQSQHRGSVVAQHGLTVDEANNLSMKLTDDPEGFATSVIKGFGDAYIELGSERARPVDW